MGFFWDDYLYSPVIDASVYEDLLLTASVNFQNYGISGGDHGYVYATTDGGATLTELAHYTAGMNWYNGQTDTWDISAIADGSDTLQIAFRYVTDADWEWWFQVDNVEITGNAAAPVPEPSTILLMSTGLLGLVAYNRKRFSKKS